MKTDTWVSLPSFSSVNFNITTHCLEIINFKYDSEIKSDSLYFWLDAFSNDIGNIREELGLERFRNDLTFGGIQRTSYHITIGNKMKFLPIICTEEYNAVIEYRGQKYSVEIDILYDNDCVPKKCKVVSFEKTLDKDLSVSKRLKYLKGNFVKWGGYPRFLQEECWPATDEGIPYDFLCTVENQWGDMGNCNIFILTKKVECDVLKDNYHYEIVDVYMEASCC